MLDVEIVLADDVMDDDDWEEEEDETLFNYNDDVVDEPEEIVPVQDDSDIE
ncbi:hypothetical protein MKX01_008575 [Papaver californicum]|nr:hypothetical protein MKX01_008575 [Papaver californicum]